MTVHRMPGERTEPGFVFKVLFVALVAALIAAIYTVAQVFILAFGSAIVAAGLNNLAAPVAKRLHLPHRFALFLTAIVLVAAFVIFLMNFGSETADRFQDLYNQLPAAWTKTQAWLGTFSLGRYALELLETVPENSANGIMRALPLAGGVFTWLANAVLILIIGMYLAADANTYIDGAIQLFPPQRRERTRCIINTAGDDLRKWLIAMALDMLFVGTSIWIGLSIVGTPFAFALGAITGISVFVPYIGPLLSMIPGLLLALSVSPELAAYTLIVYTVALQLESNVSLPLLQRWTAHMPPAISMLAIVGFGLLFGIWGVLLATPMAVVTMTFIRMAYVEDFLEHRAAIDKV